MNDRPPHNTDANRDGRGRFAKGNKAGKGNLYHRRVAEFVNRSRLPVLTGERTAPRAVHWARGVTLVADQNR